MAVAEASEGSKSSSDSPSRSSAGVVALNKSPGFWMITGYAVLFGVVLAFAALAFLALLKGGTNLWFTLPKNPGWFDGSLWWVAVTARRRGLVGVLRRVFRSGSRYPARSRS